MVTVIAALVLATPDWGKGSEANGFYVQQENGEVYSNCRQYCLSSNRYQPQQYCYFLSTAATLNREGN